LDDGGSVAKSRLLLSKFITPRRLKTIQRKKELREVRRSPSATTSKRPPRVEATSNGVKKLRHHMDRWLKRTLRKAEKSCTTTTSALIRYCGGDLFLDFDSIVIRIESDIDDLFLFLLSFTDDLNLSCSFKKDQDLSMLLFHLCKEKEKIDIERE
jgi:hypothetical protein